MHPTLIERIKCEDHVDGAGHSQKPEDAIEDQGLGSAHDAGRQNKRAKQAEAAEMDRRERVFRQCAEAVGPDVEQRQADANDHDRLAQRALRGVALRTADIHIRLMNIVGFGPRLSHSVAPLRERGPECSDPPSSSLYQKLYQPRR